MIEYYELPYKRKEVSQDELEITQAAEFAQTVVKSDISHLIKCEKIIEDTLVIKKGSEVILFCIQVPVGQEPIKDIRFEETIAILFEQKSNNYPWVFALRKEFPELIHLNLWEFEKPRCLCVYDQDFQEGKINWRPSKFIEDISSWLYRSAYDKLHLNDQPLEPFLIWTEGRIILPNELRDNTSLSVYPITQEPNGKFNFIASYENLKYSNLQGLPCHALVIKGNSQEHGILRSHPRTIYDLSKFLKNAKVKLFNLLESDLKKLKAKSDHRLLIITELPKKSAADNRVGELDIYAFISLDDIEKIGVELNLWEKQDGNLIDILFENLKVEGSKNLKVGILQPSLEFTKDQAALFNTISQEEQKIKITQIGCGSLGSNFFINLSRMGFGVWQLIDEDVLLPHNLARHVLEKWNIGFPKSKEVSRQANDFLNSLEHSSAIWDNVLIPKEPDLVRNALRNADVIIDSSTSIAVERELVNEKYGDGRRISMFLNPSGTDLVILAEDKERETHLDLLEFQFYKKLINPPLISDHLLSGKELVRYSNSCRDISNRIPNYNVTILASIASKRVRKIIENRKAQIGLWRINDDASVQYFNIETHCPQKRCSNGWDVVIDSGLIKMITCERLKKLPNETGGILIGGYDVYRKRIYVIDTILSPKDSQEYPNAYIRGIDEVEEKLELFSRVTDGNLKYIGEWHSHPPDASLNPSEDDKKLFSWLKEEMGKINLPALMLIMGSDDDYKIYVEKI